MSISGAVVAGEIFITLDSIFKFFCTKEMSCKKEEERWAIVHEDKSEQNYKKEMLVIS